MNNILKYIIGFFKTFEKDHTFYIDGKRIEFCRATNLYVIWDTGTEWGCLGKEEINAVTIEGASLKITASDGKEYTFICQA